MDCESVERVANAFSKVPFQSTFFFHPLPGSTALERDMSSSSDHPTIASTTKPAISH
jgi:hypothetical protein